MVTQEPSPALGPSAGFLVSRLFGPLDSACVVGMLLTSSISGDPAGVSGEADDER